MKITDENYGKIGDSCENIPLSGTTAGVIINDDPIDCDADIGEMTIKQLKAFADQGGIVVTAARKDDIIAQIKEVLGGEGEADNEADAELEGLEKEAVIQKFQERLESLPSDEARALVEPFIEDEYSELTTPRMIELFLEPYEADKKEVVIQDYKHFFETQVVSEGSEVSENDA